MSISRARSIDELYDAVGEVDVVVTHDAPLSLALNRRIDQAHLGRFAATPRMLASGEFRPDDKRQLFLEVIDQTDLGWKHAEYLIEHALGCWEETGQRDAILEYDRYDTSAMRTVLEILAETPNTHQDVAEFALDEDLDVAVIGYDHFNELDRRILPSSFETEPMLTGATFDFPDIRLFDSKTAIVDALVDIVTPEVADQVGIVMDANSPYPALLESAFEANEIPYHGGPDVADQPGIRMFVQALRHGVAGRTPLMADITPLLHFCNINPPVRDGYKRLDKVDDASLDPVRELLADVSNRTFSDVASHLESIADTALDRVRDELDAVGIADRRVTSSLVDSFAFYVQSFDLPDDRDDEGVLLAHPGSAAYVDRGTVFYLGLDQGWAPDVPDRPWIDAAEKDQQYLEQFKVLLQNGIRQHYFAIDTDAGHSVSPCLYFHDLFDGDIDGFEDLPSRHQPYTPIGRDTGFDHDPVAVDPGCIETISQSSLQTFVNCPRDHFFDRLVDGPDRDFLTKGLLFHDFAEFAVANPKAVERQDIGAFVDVMVEELSPFIDPVDVSTLRTECTVGIETILRFLREDRPIERVYASYERTDATNVFADRFDVSIDSSITELRFDNEDLRAHGKVDLVHAPTTLVDYKTSSRSSPRSVVSQSAIDPVADEPDFQALMYLAHHRQEYPDEPLEFVFFHILEVLDDAVVGTSALDDALVTIPYYPVSFVEYAASEAAFDDLCADVAESNNRRKTLEQLEYDGYRQFHETHDMPDTDDPEALLNSAFAEAFRTYATEVIGDYKYVSRGVDSALKRLLRNRSAAYFADDVDAFEAFLESQVDTLNEYRRSSFPVGDPNRDRLNHPDLIRMDD